MYNGLLHLHNVLRWVILLLLVITIVRSFAGMTGNKPFSSGDRKLGTFLMICAHITFLIGVYQWIAGDLGLKAIQSAGMGVIMKNANPRFWAIEHPVGMLLAIILITVGRRQSKAPVSDTIKHKRTFWYYLVALIIIIAVVPWPFREGIARPWFPGVS
ncbi:MAG TPA: hypothetical protein VD993_08725 [Chitinophagaceae bacterium]|nr:hypothetical protein [Chitinophagaceae bacterium]